MIVMLIAAPAGDSDRPPREAAVAALLGGRSATATLGKASESFRAQPLHTLKREELAHNKPDPTMHAKTERAEIGGVDAFASHSWSDDGNANQAQQIPQKVRISAKEFAAKWEAREHEGLQADEARVAKSRFQLELAQRGKLHGGVRS